MRCTVVWTVLCITACLEGERVRGNVPVGTVAPPPLASAETFLRRAFADLQGVVPPAADARWTRALAALGGGLSPEARRAVAAELIDDATYADAYFDEHVTPLFSAVGGLESAYQFLTTYLDEVAGMSTNPDERQYLATYRANLTSERDELLDLPRRLHARELDEADVQRRRRRRRARAGAHLAEVVDRVAAAGGEEQEEREDRGLHRLAYSSEATMAVRSAR